VDDPAPVGGFEGQRDPRREPKRLEDERAHAVRLLEAVDAPDVRVVERREQLGFAAEARRAHRVVREGVRQDLERDFAAELRVAGAVDDAHAAGAERADDLVRAESGAGRESHGWGD
jgi:hypothetical protein